MANLTIEVAHDHLALLSAIVSSYDGLIAGKIGNINLTKEDYSQIDKKEMELMDLHWEMASIVRRVKDFMQKTGRNGFQINNHMTFGTKRKSHV